MAILDTYFEIAPVSQQSRWRMFFFSNKYTKNTMNITYAKIKKNHGAEFSKPQPARASLSPCIVIKTSGFRFNKIKCKPPWTSYNTSNTIKFTYTWYWSLTGGLYTVTCSCCCLRCWWILGFVGVYCSIWGFYNVKKYVT